MELKENIAGLAHFGLYVKDMAACKKFYTEVLGFETAFETDPASGLWLCFLRKGDCEVELVNKPDAALSDGHFNHLCLKVKDIEAAVAALKKVGVETEFPIRTMSGVYHGIKMVMFRGPAGEHLEFNEFL